VGISAQTLNKQFMTAAASGSYAHSVPAGGSNRALIVTVGTTNSVVSISSVQWDPDTTVAGNEQTLSCPASSQVTMGTNRKLAICTLLSPTASSGNGRITVALSGGTDSFTSSATSLTGVSGFRTATTSGGGLTFASWSGCTAGTGNYTCSLNVATTSDDAVFDLAGQGEPDPAGSRSFTAGSGQTKHDDSPTLSTGAHLRIATSFAIASASTRTMAWTYGGATTANGVGHVALPLIPASTVTAARIGARTAIHQSGVGTHVAWETEEEASHLGFRVWRERAGQRVEVSGGLIPGSTFTTGAHPLAGRRGYDLWDDKGRAGDKYWLEEIAARGPARWHGPIATSTGPPGDRKLKQRAKPPSGGAATLAAPAAPDPLIVPRLPLPEPSAAAACANPPAAGQAVKIAVSSTGWYRVEAAALTAAGLPADVDVSRLALWADGEPVAFRAIGAGKLEAIEFYGQAADTRETGARIYWLGAGDQPGRSIPVQAPAQRPDLTTSASYVAEATLKERTFYFAALLNGRADNFFGAVLATTQSPETSGSRGRWMTSRPPWSRCCRARRPTRTRSPLG
jgi:hypothetical protein